MATAIKHKPNIKVSSLGSPTRGSGNHKMTATWKVPSAMTKGDRRATGLDVRWIVTTKSTKKELNKEVGTGTTSSTLNLSNFSIGSKTYSRQSFYPVTTTRIMSVTAKVRGTNSKGNGEWASATRKFSTPRKPVVTDIGFDTSNGRLSTTVTTNESADYRERYDTRYRVTIRGRTGNVFNPSGLDSSSTSTSIPLYYDAANYQNMTYDQYIKMTVEAWSRGYAGSSGSVTKVFYLAYPKQATIRNTDITSVSGQCLVRIDTNTTTEHPVDAVELQYLANVTYAKISDIPQNAEWEDSGVVDDGNCKALAIPVATLTPDVGKYSYIRVKSSRQNLIRYSEPKALTELHTESIAPQADDVTLISATASGNSAVLQLGWNKNGQDDSTGTEISWATEEDAWKSTDDPDNYEFIWSDGSYTSGGVTYRDSAKITIKGLMEGTKYFIKARRYLEYDGSTLYGKYSNVKTIITYEPPDAVVARCDGEITQGDPLSVYWTISSKSLQKEWQIKTSAGKTIRGTGTIGATQISASDVNRLASNGVLTFQVGASTGSEFVWSEWHEVKILQRPTLTLNLPATMTAQPYSFTATSSSLCDLIVTVTSQGASGQFPQGFRTQVAGDTIYSDVVSAVWSNNSTTVTLPSELDFWDLGEYTVAVTAIDRQTGLRSDEVTGTFSVAWAVKAVDPDDAISLLALDYQNEGEEHVQAVQITLVPPTGSSSTDVYDIYRMDGDTAHLIGEGFPLTCVVTDYYAPFGDDVYYRVAIRTIDGDVAFADKEYELVSDTVRFDWAGGSLEFPYGITIGDSYKKDVEFRQHMDGSVDGYWNENIERKGSYSSAVIKLIQPDEINLTRQLARYAGAVFVRTANGSAYTADVQVTDLSVKNKAVTMVAMDATEVGITDEFMLASPFELGDDE